MIGTSGMMNELNSTDKYFLIKVSPKLSYFILCLIYRASIDPQRLSGETRQYSGHVTLPARFGKPRPAGGSPIGRGPA